MRYLLDTDICSYVLRGRHPRLLAVMEEKTRAGADLSISVVTYAEMRLGAERSPYAERYNLAIRAFCDRLTGVLAWDRPAADRFAGLQSRLLETGRPIGGNDAMIAAHALSLGRVLVSNNERHFSGVSGLSVENWTRS